MTVILSSLYIHIPGKLRWLGHIVGMDDRWHVKMLLYNKELVTPDQSADLNSNLKIT